jgi:hypothetical protein
MTKRSEWVGKRDRLKADSATVVETMRHSGHHWQTTMIVNGEYEVYIRVHGIRGRGYDKMYERSGRVVYLWLLTDFDQTVVPP